MDDTKTITNCLSTLDELELQLSGLENILSMLSDSANNGANSVDDYKAGIWLISELAFEYKERLTEINTTLAECIKKELKNDE